MFKYFLQGRWAPEFGLTCLKYLIVVEGRDQQWKDIICDVLKAMII